MSFPLVFGCVCVCGGGGGWMGGWGGGGSQGGLDVNLIVSVPELLQLRLIQTEIIVNDI